MFQHLKTYIKLIPTAKVIRFLLVLGDKFLSCKKKKEDFEEFAVFFALLQNPTTIIRNVLTAITIQ